MPDELSRCNTSEFERSHMATNPVSSEAKNVTFSSGDTLFQADDFVKFRSLHRLIMIILQP